MSQLDAVGSSRQQTPPPPPPPPEEHEVQPGETMKEIAARYRVQTQELADANPQVTNPDVVHPGERLTLPDNAQTPGLHRVESGETLTQIAGRTDASAGEIAQANGLNNPNRIQVGQELWIPGGGQTPPVTQDSGVTQPVTQSGSPPSPVDTAVSNLQQATQTLDSIESEAAQGNGAARAELHDGYLQQNVTNAETALSHAVKTEIRDRLADLPGQASNQTAIGQIGADISSRYADPAVQDVVNRATGDLQATQAVDDALLRLNSTQDALAAVQQSASQGDGAARADLQDGYLQQNVNDAQVGLKNAVAAEIARQGSPDPSPATVDRVGGEITARYANNPAAQTAVRDAVAQVRTDREVDTILDNAEAAGTPRDQLVRLNEGYVGASSEAQTQLLADPRATALFDGAARSANEPLAQLPDETQTEEVQPQTNEAMTKLNQITEGLDATIAARVVQSALPDYEQVFQQNGQYPILGTNGTYTATVIADRVWSAPNGNDLVSRIVGLGTANALGLQSPLFEGYGPAYLLELERQGGVMPGGSSLMDASIDGARVFQDNQLSENAEEYLGHIDELGFLVQNGRTAMTPEQLDAAINDYVASKGPEWQQQLEGLQNQLASDGARLLNQVTQLNAAVANAPADQQADYRQQISEILNDPQSQLAVSMALRQQPQLTDGAGGEQLVRTFADLGITGSDNSLATTLVTAYLRQNVMDPASSIDLSNPASLEAARNDLTDALRDNPELARVLEISPQQLNEVADELIGLVPRPGSNINEFTYANNVARNANNAFDKLDDAFGRHTPFNTGFRMSAVAIVGSGLVNSTSDFAENPTVRGGLDVLLNSARVGVDSAQLIAAMRQLPANSTAVTGLQAAGKFVHLLGAGLAGVDAVGRLSQGDYFGAGLNAAVAGGVGYAMLGSSAWAGPIGFGIAAAASAGLFIYDGIRSAQHNSRFETDTTASFLEHAGFTPQAARALVDQSGEGYSPVPILMRYGELRGLTPEQTVDWINSIGEPQLAALRDNLHQSLDEIDGDVSRFNQTADDDEWVVNDTEQRPWFAATGVAQPASAAQLDAILDVLEIPVPHA